MFGSDFYTMFRQLFPMYFKGLSYVPTPLILWRWTLRKINIEPVLVALDRRSQSLLKTRRVSYSADNETGKFICKAVNTTDAFRSRRIYLLRI